MAVMAGSASLPDGTADCRSSLAATLRKTARFPAGCSTQTPCKSTVVVSRATGEGPVVEVGIAPQPGGCVQDGQQEAAAGAGCRRFESLASCRSSIVEASPRNVA